jgi:hypothetical protein
MDAQPGEPSHISNELSRRSSIPSNNPSEPASWTINQVGDAVREGFADLKVEMSRLGSEVANLKNVVAMN